MASKKAGQTSPDNREPMATTPRIEMVSLDKLKPYENNPRKNDAAVKPVAESIRQFGFKVPIIVDRDGVIVSGHTRWKAARLLGMTEVPCVVANDLTPEQVKAFRLADNKVAEIAEWDFEALEIELGEIKEIGDLLDFDMTDFGFKDYEKLPSYTIAQNEALPFTAVHYMITADINQNDELLPLIEQLKQIEGVQVECSCNRNR